MYGLKAISAANGWVITVAGISIVFSGLLVLSFLIANMERAIHFFDRQKEKLKQAKLSSEPELSKGSKKIKPPKKPSITKVVWLTSEEIEIYNYYRWITERLGEPFSLPRLLGQAEKRGILRPYFHLDMFLRQGLIYDAGGDKVGLFRWARDVRIEKVEKKAKDKRK